MRIGIDCRMAGTGEGIGRYVEELIKHLSEIDNENIYVLLFSESMLASKFQISNDKFQKIIVKSKYYSLSEQTYFIWELFKLKLDIVHFPSFNVPILYPGKFVVTIHDIIHHRFPGRKKSRFVHRLAYRLVIWAAIKRAKRIIAVSEATKRDILKVFHVGLEKITVIYEGAGLKLASINDTDAVLKRYNIQKPFLLFVGVWRQYKNLPRLAAAFDLVRDKYSLDCELVLAGKIDDFYPEIKNEILSIKNADYIRALGYVPEPDLAALYRAARIFVIPSLTEGFGLVGIEAQSSGTAVLASDIAVLREVLGSGALYFNPRNVEDMAEKISTLWQNEASLEDSRRAGRDNAARFTWTKTAEGTKMIYNSIAWDF